jgi:hypothetical protein
VRHCGGMAPDRSRTMLPPIVAFTGATIPTPSPARSSRSPRKSSGTRTNTRWRRTSASARSFGRARARGSASTRATLPQLNLRLGLRAFTPSGIVCRAASVFRPTLRQQGSASAAPALTITSGAAGVVEGSKRATTAPGAAQNVMRPIDSGQEAEREESGRRRRRAAG